MNNHKVKILNERLFDNEVKYADMVYLRQPIDDQWHEFTWKETMLQARKMCAFLKSLGLQKGDKVSIFSKNCAEWFIADFAISLGGFISIPLFATQHKDNIKYVLEHAEVKAIFVGKLDDWKKQESGIPDHIPRISFPYAHPMPAKYKWADVLKKTDPDMENFIPNKEDIYTIIYTSGTTGNPKGAMISYGAFAESANILIANGVYGVIEEENLFSYLPLGHITERIIYENISTAVKSRVSFTESLPKFAHNLEEVQPSIFFAVPRIWTQFQKNILSKIPEGIFNVLIRLPIISGVLKKKLRHKLGLTQARLIGSGSAPISMELLKWFRKLDIQIVEGYGRTEDLATCSINRNDRFKMGTCGIPFKGVEVKIGEDGEILTRSKAMMTGYYKEPEITKASFTKDGFLKTGDKGHIDEDGYLTILGRINDSFKTDKGEFVNPIPIEGKFAKNTLIEQACLIGLNLPQPVLLAVLSEASKKKSRADIEKSLGATLLAINKSMTKFEKVAHIIIAAEAWTPENALLTPTLKMKRNVLHDKYLDLATKAIHDKTLVLWE